MVWVIAASNMKFFKKSENITDWYFAKSKIARVQGRRTRNYLRQARKDLIRIENESSVLCIEELLRLQNVEDIGRPPVVGDMAGRSETMGRTRVESNRSPNNHSSRISSRGEGASRDESGHVWFLLTRTGWAVMKLCFKPYGLIFVDRIRTYILEDEKSMSLSLCVRAADEARQIKILVISLGSLAVP